MVSVLVSLLIGLALILGLSFGVNNDSSAASWFTYIVPVSLAGTLLLVTLFIWQLVRLVSRMRAGVFGSRMVGRMFWHYALMALVPGLIVWSVSLFFISQSIEGWLNPQVESALTGGRALSNKVVDHLKTELRRKGDRLVSALQDLPPSRRMLQLDSLRAEAGLREVTLYSTHASVLHYSDEHSYSMQPPEKVAVEVLRLVPYGKPRLTTEVLSDGELQLRMVAKLMGSGLSSDQFLVISERLSPELVKAMQDVNDVSSQYESIKSDRGRLKGIFLYALTMILALALFASIQLAFLFAERMVAPMRALNRGTRAVGRGDFRQVSQALNTHDEFGQLIQSFNQMTVQLNEASTAAQQHQSRLEETKRYLESILGSVNTGVVTLDASLRVRLVNPAAARVLGVVREKLEGMELHAWGEPDSPLRILAETMAEHFRMAAGQPWSEQAEFRLDNERRILLVRGTPITAGETPDYALVFDEVTQLLRAQKDAAWGEVARRLAHEVKNPLTPIQLSVERLQYRLADKLVPSDRLMLDRSADTIIQQVNAMKALVDAFSHYARTPTPVIHSVDLNALVNEVLSLYEGQSAIVPVLGEALPSVAGDRVLLNRVLVNLIKNGMEAQEGQADARIIIRTHLGPSGVCLSVEDNGPGFSEAQMGRIFEPYATSKPKGSGLGLPIVKRIIEEHHGQIEVHNLVPHGASVSLTLPIMEEKKDE